MNGCDTMDSVVEEENTCRVSAIDPDPAVVRLMAPKRLMSRGKVVLAKPRKASNSRVKRYSQLTGKELNRALAENSLTQQQFARMTGIVHTTIFNWCSGRSDGKIPVWVDLVLELCRTKPSVRLREIGSRGPRPKHHTDDNDG
jgi:DNA-binding transcriptional regulator YiaG